TRRGLVRDLSAVPVGRRVGGAHRAARRRNACAAHLQPASLRPQYPGECALFAPASAGDSALARVGMLALACLVDAANRRASSSSFVLVVGLESTATNRGPE